VLIRVSGVWFFEDTAGFPISASQGIAEGRFCFRSQFSPSVPPVMVFA